MRWDLTQRTAAPIPSCALAPVLFCSIWSKLFSNKMSNNNRKNDRLRVNCPVQVTEKGVAAAVRCNMADISPGGCYIETVLPFPVSAELEITFSPLGFPVKVRGTVQYVHPQMGMGLKFIWKDEEPFNRLLAQLEKEQSTSEVAF